MIERNITLGFTSREIVDYPDIADLIFAGRNSVIFQHFPELAQAQTTADARMIRVRSQSSADSRLFTVDLLFAIPSANISMWDLIIPQSADTVFRLIGAAQ